MVEKTNGKHTKEQPKRKERNAATCFIRVGFIVVAVSRPLAVPLRLSPLSLVISHLALWFRLIHGITDDDPSRTMLMLFLLLFVVVRNRFAPFRVDCCDRPFVTLVSAVVVVLSACCR